MKRGVIGAIAMTTAAVVATAGTGSAGAAGAPAGSDALGSTSSYSTTVSVPVRPAPSDTLILRDQTVPSVVDLGSCAACTSLDVSGLNPAHRYRVEVVSNSTTLVPVARTTAAVPTAKDARHTVAASSNSTKKVDVSCAFVSCANAPAANPTDYSATYIASDGSAATVTAGSSKAMFAPATSGSPGAARGAVVDGSLSISVQQPKMLKPMTSTPSGYHLYGPTSRRDTYNWHSDTGQMKITKSVRGTVYLVGSITEYLWEGLNGGSSHLFLLTVHAAYQAGDPFSFYFLYNCGINVPGAADHACRDHSGDATGSYDDAPVHESVGNYTQTWGFNFGSNETNYKKFPMMDYRLSYVDGGGTVSTNLYHRGHDIEYAHSEWEMSTSTGTGS